MRESTLTALGIVFGVVALPLSLILGINLMFDDILNYDLQTWTGAGVCLVAVKAF